MYIGLEILERLRKTTRLLMTSQRSLETSAIFRFAPMPAKGCRDRGSFLDFFGSLSAGASCCVNSLLRYPLPKLRNNFSNTRWETILVYGMHRIHKYISYNNRHNYCHDPRSESMPKWYEAGCFITLSVYCHCMGQ